MKALILLAILSLASSVYAQDSSTTETESDRSKPTYGIDFAGSNYNAHHSGLTLALSCIGKVRNGLCLVLANEAEKVNGVSIAPLINKADTLNGVAISGLFYGWVSSCVTPPELTNGVAISGFVSLAKKCNGLIVSPINVTQKLAGVQIGTVNVAHELHGVQFGLINYAGNGLVKWFPIINIAI
jgi:hypothetical protein